MGLFSGLVYTIQNNRLCRFDTALLRAPALRRASRFKIFPEDFIGDDDNYILFTNESDEKNTCLISQKVNKNDFFCRSQLKLAPTGAIFLSLISRLFYL